MQAVTTSANATKPPRTTAVRSPLGLRFSVGERIKPPRSVWVGSAGYLMERDGATAGNESPNARLSTNWAYDSPLFARAMRSFRCAYIFASSAGFMKKHRDSAGHLKSRASTFEIFS